MSKLTLIERLHALRESLWGSEHDEKRRTIADAIARIEAAEASLLSIIEPADKWECEHGVPITEPCLDEDGSAMECTASPVRLWRALVREQDGGEK